MEETGGSFVDEGLPEVDKARSKTATSSSHGATWDVLFLSLEPVSLSVEKVLDLFFSHQFSPQLKGLLSVDLNSAILPY